jgi:D-alanyl-D-alanine carboxypeptidase (penicillin-binding protein 5/6)
MSPRRALLAALAALLTFAPAAAAQQTPAGPRLEGAEAAIVMEASTGDVLFARNPHLRREIASTTKLMTV